VDRANLDVDGATDALEPGPVGDGEGDDVAAGGAEAADRAADVITDAAPRDGERRDVDGDPHPPRTRR
jgi:hypothetical protein